MAGVDPVTLTWNNLSVYLSSQSCGTCCPTGSTPPKAAVGPRKLLDNVNGIVEPGTLLAVMGSSGAGKSTLLNVLGRRDMGDMVVQGDIRINGQHIGSGLQRVCGYVQQFEAFIGTLKVKEQLWFQACLRMESKYSKAERKQKVDSVMRELGLSKCSDTLIGVPGVIKGISGGERRRLAIGCEMLTNPSLLLCDEPTSGLDSYMAQNVITMLNNLAADGHSIICVIHQPSSEVFSLFDKVLIMEEGRECFMGSTDDALSFFERCGHRCPDNFNPADHFIHTLAVVPGNEEQCRQIGHYIMDSYKKSDNRLQIKSAINKVCHGEQLHPTKKFADYSPYRASWLRQFQAVLWRSWLSSFREPAVFWARMIPVIGQMLIIILLYARQDYDQEGVNNLNGCMFLMLTQMTFGFAWSIVSTFPLEFPIFRKEHHDAMYRADTYFLGKMVAELPQFLILPIVFTTPLYWAVGLETTASAFFIALAVNILIGNVSASFGYLLSCLSSNLPVLFAMAPISLVPIMIVGGYFINISTIPVFISWAQWISWYRYGNEILLSNQWADVQNITCDPSETLCLFRNGQEVLEFYAFDEDRLELNFIMLVILLVSYRILSYILLSLRSLKCFKVYPVHPEVEIIVDTEHIENNKTVFSVEKNNESWESGHHNDSHTSSTTKF